MSSQTEKQGSPSAVEPTSDRVARMVVVGILGGIPVGILVGGVGARLIMRVLAMVNEEQAGVLTENGAISGEITAGGTISLIISVGVVSGVISGFGYVMIRRWLPSEGLLKGLAFGLFLLCFSGAIPPSLAPLFNNEVDFALFGPGLLSVGLFALLFMLVGIGVSLFIERFDQYVPPLFDRSSVTVLGYLSIAGLCAIGLFFTVPAIIDIL